MNDQDPLQIWGGAEYTCNRVEDTYHDQMTCSGHLTRLEDYERFAALGLKTLRVGLLWEHQENDPDWAARDTRLNLMQKLGISPVAGLLHHGSGPAHTSLLDPDFAVGLAEYAGKVAERYPWIEAYTPVNEPNTTARFSCRYGLWYPHHRSQQSYFRALLNELKATVLSMRAIRRVQPRARLIQTEDLGTISSTPELESERQRLHHCRWSTYDLLCGEVDRDHPLYRIMRSTGVSEHEILWFLDNPCPPDIIGVNYYVTSDRFLDQRVEHYSPDRGSIEGPFVDVEAVRVQGKEIAGFDSILVEAWQRYHLPLAITEVHLGDCATEQIRWLVEAWQGAKRARSAGVNCIALTIWALLGSFHWNVLVTSRDGRYEPGVFDITSGVPVPTQLAEVVAQLAHGENLTHPALSEQGWWRRDDRFAYWPLAQPQHPIASPDIAEDLLQSGA